MPIVSYLAPRKADVHARDADGWTALHNACSKVCSCRWSVSGHGIQASLKGLPRYREIPLREGGSHVRERCSCCGCP